MPRDDAYAEVVINGSRDMLQQAVADQNCHAYNNALQILGLLAADIRERGARGLPVLLLAADGHVLDASPSACRLLGYTHAQLCVANVHDLHPSEDVEAIAARFAEISAGGITNLLSIRQFRHASGAPLWLRTSTAPTFTLDAEVVFFIVRIDEVVIDPDDQVVTLKPLPGRLNVEALLRSLSGQEGPDDEPDGVALLRAEMGGGDSQGR